MGNILTYEKKREILQSMNLTSDIFSSKVFESPEVLEELLMILTGRQMKLREVRSQYSIRNLSTHSVVLDVYAEDAQGCLVHLEIQNRDNDQHLKRTRYCRSCIDGTQLDRGVPYGDLPDLIQIFITKKDFLKSGCALVYNTKKYEDGVTEIYFNLSSKSGEPEAIGHLQQYFLNTTPENESPYFPMLVNRVNFLKYDTKGVDDMCEIMDKIRLDGVEEGMKEGSLTSWREALCQLLQETGMIPEGLYEKIQNQENESCLKDWFRIAVHAGSIEEFTRAAGLA